MPGHKGLVCNCVKRNGMCLRFASSELQGDIDIVKATCSNNGWALQFASNDLQEANYEVVTTACKSNASALKYASNKLQGNERVAMTFVFQWSADCLILH